MAVDPSGAGRAGGGESLTTDYTDSTDETNFMSKGKSGNKAPTIIEAVAQIDSLHQASVAMKQTPGQGTQPTEGEERTPGKDAQPTVAKRSFWQVYG